MSYLLFVDESGHDRKLAPAEVLGGFAIRDGALWSFIQAVYALQTEIFGVTYPALNAERRAAKTKTTDGDLDIKEIKGDEYTKYALMTEEFVERMKKIVDKSLH